MSEFLSLVLAIYLADALFEVTRLVVSYVSRMSRRQSRDSRGRFLPKRAG